MVFKYSFLLAVAISVVTGTPTAQCCSSVIAWSDTTAANYSLLSLLGIPLPTAGKIGFGCQALNTSCPRNCTDHAVSCSMVTSCESGNIGTNCDFLSPCKPPCKTIGTKTSPLYGAETGDAFNDLVAVAGNGTLTTDNAPSIQAVNLRYGSVIDGVAITYRHGTGQSSITISHGTSITAVGPMNTTFTLNGI